MIIIAGALRVDAADRERYLAAVVDVARLARDAPGCLDFIQAADPLDAEVIHVYERWDADEDVLAFRSSGGPGPDLPPLLSADVRKYRISGVEAP